MNTKTDAAPDAALSRRQWVGLVSIPLLAAAAGTALLNRPAAATPAQPADPNLAGARVFNIRDFGATGDGQTFDTKAVQSAIDAATADQGGTVLVPAGVFVIGTIEMKSNVTLHIAAGGTLLGSPVGREYYAADAIPLEGDTTLEDGNVGLIFAANANNVTIEGPGTVDGNGTRFYTPRGSTNRPPAGLTGDHRPHLLLFYRCTNLRIANIFLTASAYHCVRIIQSTYVQCDGIHIHNRVIHNNDGFHFISAQFVNISNCNVESLDDACALFGSCQNVTVTNSSFSTRWSVFRFGGGHVQNIAVSNCLLYQVYGCPIKLQGNPGSSYENMSFSNLVMQDVTGPICLGLSSQGRRGNRRRGGATTQNSTLPSTRPGRTRGYVRNVSFNNIRATVPAMPEQLPDVTFQSTYNPGEIHSCICLNGVGDSYLENISLNDVEITFGGGGTAQMAAVRDVPQRAGEYFALGILPAYALYARNVHGLTLQNVRFRVASPEMRPAIVFDHVQDASVTGLSAEGNPQAESLLRFIDSKETLLHSPRVVASAAVFLRVEGADSGQIIVDGGDISSATSPVAFAAGADEKSVTLRT